jgi:hypothetical protein
VFVQVCESRWIYPFLLSYKWILSKGITMKPLVEFLKVKREENQEKTMNERLHEKVFYY